MNCLNIMNMPLKYWELMIKNKFKINEFDELFSNSDFILKRSLFANSNFKASKWLDSKYKNLALEIVKDTRALKLCQNKYDKVDYLLAKNKFGKEVKIKVPILYWLAVVLR